MTPLRIRVVAFPALIAALLTRPPSLYPQLHPPDVTCDNGSGDYSYHFFTGTTVTVGPPHNDGFAQRTCAADLAWGKQDLGIASHAAQITVDVLGADIGLGNSVVAFQLDETGNGTRRTYQIYSLAKPPRLLYTLTGADSYIAADTDLDGKVEIWSDDATAIDGFESIPLKFWDSAPTAVLGFEKKRLVDVSPGFASHYDTQIAQLRAQIDPAALAAFKNSNGILSASGAASDAALHRLIRTKIAVLEIVWAWLYSGRDAQAWSALQQMWPTEDFNRIKAKISAVHQNGILRGVPRATANPKHKHQVHIFDATALSQAENWDFMNSADSIGNLTQKGPSVVPPKSILLRRSPLSEVEDPHTANAIVELVVDAAGKVHSATMLNGANPNWIQASVGWHFIPAFFNGNPVACRFRTSVSNLK